MKKEIGQAIIKYDRDGNVKTALFEPTMKIEVEKNKLKELFHSKGTTKEEVQRQADIVFASWFNKMNEIELADRETYEVISEVVSCKEYKVGGVKTCVLKYFFSQRNTELN